MREKFPNSNEIRDYLLGKITEEARLQEFEELLFSDNDFTDTIRASEEFLIEDYLSEKLSLEDKNLFERNFLSSSTRREQVKTSIALRKLTEKESGEEVKEILPKTSPFSWLFQPQFAFGSVLILALGFGLFYFFQFRQDEADKGLVQLQEIYQKQRPVESRQSNFDDYRPFSVTRGDDLQTKSTALKLAEKRFLEAVETSPSAKSHHALGVFYLTERKYSEAVEQLEKALKFNSEDAKIHNDLGTAFLELSKQSEVEKKLELLTKALEEFEKALRIEPSLLTAMFNKGLCLQEFPQLYFQTKEAWEKYLEKDSSSGWAEEARRNLQKLEEKNKTSKTNKEVLEDFLAAYRRGETEFAWKINLQTKELITETWLPGQLTRRYLEAKLQDNEAEATESLETLKFIGQLEKERNADFFVFDLADYYQKTNKYEWISLLESKKLLSESYKLSLDSKYDEALKKLGEVQRLLKKSNNAGEENIIRYWIAFSETNQDKLLLSNKNFEEIRNFAKKKSYKWLEAIALMRLSANSFRLNKRSESLELSVKSLLLFEKLQDTYHFQLVNNNQAIFFEELGDLPKSVSFAGKSLFVKDLYYESRLQKLRNFYNVSDILIKLKRFYGAIEFGKELIQNINRDNSNKEVVYYSMIPPALSLAKVGKFEESLKILEESKAIAESVADESVKSKLAFTNLQIANVQSLSANYQQALINYNLSLDLYREVPENGVWLYQVHKGKMFCFQHLQRKAELQAEIETVLNLLENYRTQIIEEQNRNIFFDNEQNVIETAVNFELQSNNPQKAFEYAESFKARSLLDFILGEVSEKKSEISFTNIVSPLNLAEIQSRLSAEMQIVEYVVLPEKVVIWVIGKEKVSFAEKTIPADVLEEKIQHYLHLLVNEKRKDDELKKTSGELYEVLVSPVLPFLDNQKTICLIPDKSLFKLPFSSLFSEKNKRFLLEDFKIFYSPSASVSIIASENAKKKEIFPTESFLGVGNPRFDIQNNSGLQTLPSAETEIREISKIYPQNKQFIGENALKSKILIELNEKNIFHFAGHYVTNEADTPNSKLLLAKSSVETDLTLNEIAKLRLKNTKLVVLSACQTGVEKLYQGEGAIGIARIFLAVGSPLVLASSWPVDSEATKDLMIAFHRNRKERGLTSVESLRKAQIEMLKNEKDGFQSPYFWSAFSLVGGLTNY